MLIDIACNITHYKAEDCDTIIQHCMQNNTMPVLVGINRHTTLICIALCRKYNLLCYGGIHPTESKREQSLNQELNNTNTTDFLKEIINNNCVIAIGECGLDYDRLMFADKLTLKIVFKEMLACNYSCYFFHCRNAHNDFIDIIKETMAINFMKEIFGQGINLNDAINCELSNESDKIIYYKIINKIKECYDHKEGNNHSKIFNNELENKIMKILRKIRINGIIHSFRCTKDEIEEIIKFGFFVGINGCSLKRETDIFKHLPLEKILIETDAPFCSIRKSYFYWNEGIPKIKRYRLGDVQIVYKVTAQIYGISVKKLEQNC